MQFKTAHLMIVVTCFAGVMAIPDLSIFRQAITILWTVVFAWIASSIAITRNSNRAWQWGALMGVAVAFTWNLIVLLTWPTFIGRTIEFAVALPIEAFAREAAFFLALSAIIGAVVGGWVTVARRRELQKDFKVAVLMSKLILLAAIVFRLLNLVGDMRPDWGSLSVFCTLVFVIHSFNWLPRLFRKLDVPPEIEMRNEQPQVAAAVSSED